MPGRRQQMQGIDAPQLPSRLGTGGLPNDQLEEAEVYSGLLLNSLDLSGQEADDVIFEAAHLKQVSFGGTQLGALQLHDVRLDSCDLAAATWEKTTFNRAELLGCRMTGWRASESTFMHVAIKGCTAIGAQFWGSKFKQVRFEGCNLRDADFQRADLSGVVFEKCDLSNAKFSDAKLVDADLRGSKIEGVWLGVKELQGAIVDVEQAIAIARLLGVVVKLD
ncbi:MAG TPA: pentapeptide repeat-containing protein [Roseiflexaceae bacterium]|nr:pentapeptide repeat-containing protein [Roseiflexaceae bacterium]